MPDAHPDIVRQLYSEPPDGFVATRAAAVAAARTAGEPDAAKRLAALRKPTVAAWLVNLLALRRADLIDELVELAAALRTAQRDLHGDQLRELSQQRRRAVSALVAEARRLACEVDSSLTAAKLPLADVETTLTAALSDADIAAQVRSGRLVRTVSYAGFGEVPRPRLRLVTDDSLDTDDAAETDDVAEPDGGVESDDDGDGRGGAVARGSGGKAAAKGRSGVGWSGSAGTGARPAGAGRRDVVSAEDARVAGVGAGRRDAVGAEDARAAAREARAAAEEARAAAEEARASAERRDAEQRRELRRRLTAARAAETRADTALERAETAERDAAHAVTEIEAAILELERKRAAAHGEVSHRKLARRAAQRDAAAARRLVGDLQGALEDLDRHGRA